MFKDGDDAASARGRRQVLAKLCERPGCGEPRVVADHPRTLWLAATDEHDHLLGEVAQRVDAILLVTGRDRWPAPELDSLVRYLREQVLPHAEREERQSWSAHVSPSQRVRLGRDHDRLRAATAVLSRSDAGEGNRSPAQLAATARSLLIQLRRHLAVEAQALAKTTTSTKTPTRG